MKHEAELNIATINVTGLGITEWVTIIKTIRKHRIELLALQETNIGSNSTLDKEATHSFFIQPHTQTPTHPKANRRGTCVLEKGNCSENLKSSTKENRQYEIARFMGSEATSVHNHRDEQQAATSRERLDVVRDVRIDCL